MIKKTQQLTDMGINPIESQKLIRLSMRFTKTVPEGTEKIIINLKDYYKSSSISSKSSVDATLPPSLNASPSLTN